MLPPTNKAVKSKYRVTDPKITPHSSPSPPIPEGIKHRMDDPAGELSDLKGLIEQALARAIPIVTKDLAADEIEITFSPEPDRVIPELGVSGSAYEPHRVSVYIDPRHEKITTENLFATLLHEIHHCMRWRGPGLDGSLDAALVFEGLACLYEAEHLGGVPIYAAGELRDEDIEKAMGRLDAGYSHNEWFFGRGSLEHWFGYKLGYRLCKNHSKRTGRSAAQLVHTAATEILADSPNN